MRLEVLLTLPSPAPPPDGEQPPAGMRVPKESGGSSSFVLCPRVLSRAPCVNSPTSLLGLPAIALSPGGEGQRAGGLCAEEAGHVTG